MFIAHLKDGTTVTEKDCTWDEVPNIGITSLELTLPVHLKRINNETGVTEDLPAPTVHLSNYQAYYFANEAVNVVFRTLSGNVFMGDGKGEVIKQVIAGIDYEHDLIMYIEVDKKANVTVKRFPITRFTEGESKVSPEALRQGV